MLPIMMIPAFRSGDKTPWGGRKLADLFHKPVPDSHTGEALEVSAIPGLPSTDQAGNTLPALIARYGKALIGTKVSEPFPLLLKLLDAREQLSVQVHPDNEYAERVEHKLGKTEAWVILQAEPGAKLVYGIRKGTDLRTLREASQNGKEVESLLHYVSVKAGDVYYIPAGTVHAIGAGIVLYEIQQSSDVTYRFYDWDRADSSGHRRELHLEKALAVTNLDFCPAAAVPKLLREDEIGITERLLEERFFCLDRYRNAFGAVLKPSMERFSILTAIEDGGIECGNVSLPMPAGQTALIPADCDELRLTGGYFLNAFPTCPSNGGSDN